MPTAPIGPISSSSTSIPRASSSGTSLARRHGVFVDTKMNGHGQQVVAPYSLRPRPGAPVAAPLRWDEVGPALDPASFTPATVRARVERDGDLLAPLLAGRQRLERALAAFA